MTPAVASDFAGPVNVGSEEKVTINQLVALIAHAASKPVTIEHVQGPQGVRGRTSHNALIRAQLGWEPTQALAIGLSSTYEWISAQLAGGHTSMRAEPGPHEHALGAAPTRACARSRADSSLRASRADTSLRTEPRGAGSIRA